VENIVGIKEASGNISQVATLSALCRGKLDIYSGNDDEVIPILALGGVGVISVMSNVAPRRMHDMVMEYLDGDRQKALQMQLDSLPLMRALFCEVNPIPVKMALHMQGKCNAVMRLPLTEMDEKYCPALWEALQGTLPAGLEKTANT
jgi:4-hydroxy-tetrahydrodipicolinate synthase